MVSHSFSTIDASVKCAHYICSSFADAVSLDIPTSFSRSALVSVVWRKASHGTWKGSGVAGRGNVGESDQLSIVYAKWQWLSSHCLFPRPMGGCQGSLKNNCQTFTPV